MHQTTWHGVKAPFVRQHKYLWFSAFPNVRQEAQLPLREQGVSFVLSSYWECGFSEFRYTLRVGFFLANLHGNGRMGLLKK